MRTLLKWLAVETSRSYDIVLHTSYRQYIIMHLLCHRPCVYSNWHYFYNKLSFTFKPKTASERTGKEIPLKSV